MCLMRHGIENTRLFWIHLIVRVLGLYELDRQPFYIEGFSYV